MVVRCRYPEIVCWWCVHCRLAALCSAVLTCLNYIQQAGQSHLTLPHLRELEECELDLTSPLLDCVAGLSCLPLKKAAPSDTGAAGIHPEESSLTPASPTFMKARTRVTAFKASKEAVIEAMHKYPELAEALQNKVWQHKSDQAVAEAITALHLPLLGKQGT